MLHMVVIPWTVTSYCPVDIDIPLLKLFTQNILAFQHIPYTAKLSKGKTFAVFSQS